jgi:type IV pilus assembly protein PilX
MKPMVKPVHGQLSAIKQRGIVLFFALIALVALSLAAVALIRSVDTTTLIAGNLAFKQAATTAGDAGIESAINWLAATETANATKNVLTDTTHTFNITDATNGYYSNVNPALDIYAASTWDNDNTNDNTNVAHATSVIAGIDSGNNKTRYIIQRMCRTANVAIQNADCLFSGAIEDKNGQNILLPQDVCKGAGCPAAGQTPQIRITARTVGPRNTVSYVQAFVY